MPGPDDHVLEWGPIRIDLMQPTVHVGDDRVDVTLSELRILIRLVLREGAPVPARELEKILEPQPPDEPGTLSSHVFGLRQKLSATGCSVEGNRTAGFRLRVPQDG